MTTMNVLRYDRPRVARIVTSTAPIADESHSLAVTVASSVSAGTEMGFYRGTAPQIHATSDHNQLFEPRPDNLKYPMQSDGPGVWWMGYSAVGNIVEVGTGETHLKPGDLVWSGQGHKSMLRSDRFLKLPAGTNPEHASLLALIEIAFNAMLDARIKLLDNVVIFGLGTLGQLLVQMCKLSGANVTAVDGIESRRALAGKMGADYLIDPRVTDVGKTVQEFTQGRGADVVIEVTGNIQALPHAIRCAGVDGIVTVVSFYQSGAESLQLGQEFHHKRITLRSSQINAFNPALSARYDKSRRMQQAVELLGRLNLDPLITHRVPFDALPRTLEVIDRDPSVCLAVVVKYG